MIKLKNISKVYNPQKKNQLTALKNISLNIERESMIAIVGPSGSGKSTLLNIIGCMDKPSEGEYLLDGKPIVGLNQRQLGKI